MLQGKNDELVRLKTRNSKICVIELVTENGAHVNSLLTALEKTDLPFPIHMIDTNCTIGGEHVVQPSITALMAISGNASQSFIYPATFTKTPDVSFRKVNDTVVWTFYGYMRATTHLSYYN